MQGFGIDGQMTAQGVQVAQGVAILDDLVFMDTGPTKGSSIEIRGGATVTLNNSILTQATSGASEGGHIYLNSGSSLISTGGLVVENGSATDSGGGIYATDATINLMGCSFRNNTASGIGTTEGGGAIFANSASNVTLTDCTFENNTAADDGGAVQFRDSTLVEISDCTFTGNSAAKGGHIALMDGTIVTVQGSTLQSGTSDDQGGAIYVFSSSLEIDESQVLRNVAIGDGGAIASTSILQLQLTRSTFCENVSATGDGSVLAQQNIAAVFPGFISGNAFIENTATIGKEALYQEAVPVTNNTFYANSAALTPSVLSDGSLTPVINNLIVHHPSGTVALDSTSGTPIQPIQYNAFWENLGGNTTYPLDPSNIEGLDPLLVGYVAGSCDPSGLRPLVGSPIIDAGDPTITDTDGSNSDIGAFGGPDGMASAEGMDQDGDGFDIDQDCDDTDPAVYPGAVEVCDGVDQDCDELIDNGTDSDQDGIADICDPCPEDPLDDSDGDDVCDSADLCPGFDDQQDMDSDGIPDGCDPCPETDGTNTDGDGNCDESSPCVGDCDEGEPGESGLNELPPRFFCGCQTGGASPLPWTLMALTLLVARRRP